MNAHAITRAGMILALTPKPGLLPQSKPVFLRDVLAMKRERGDADCQAFRLVSKVYANGLDATIAGAAWSMHQWIAKKPDHVCDSRQAERTAFLADLNSVLSGTFGVEFRAKVA